MLPRYKQIQIIADFIAGYEPERQYSLEEFSMPLQEAWRAVRRVPWNGPEELSQYQGFCKRELRSALEKQPGGLALLGSILSTPTAPENPYRSLYDIAATLQPVRYLWENWLPVGMLSMMAAKPGTGKSLVALDFIRMIISGSPWPDGTPQPAPGANCIYVDAENVPAILNQRAEAWETWGMDRKRIYPLLADDEDVIVSLADPKYADRLADMADRLKPALIVIDSLRDILPSGESAIEDVRDVLALLSSIAVQSACAVMLIHHLRKSGQSGQLALFDSVDLDQVSGSGYIGGRARTILGLCKVQTGSIPDKNGPRKLEMVKTNLGIYPPDLGITFDQIPPEGLRLVYGEAPTRYQEATAADECAAWLLDYLEDAGEPVAPKDIEAPARDAGFGRTTLYKARELLTGQVVNTAGRRSKTNRWQLASQAGTAEEAVEPEETPGGAA